MSKSFLVKRILEVGVCYCLLIGGLSITLIIIFGPIQGKISLWFLLFIPLIIFLTHFSAMWLADKSHE